MKLNKIILAIAQAIIIYIPYKLFIEKVLTNLNLNQMQIFLTVHWFELVILVVLSAILLYTFSFFKKEFLFKNLLVIILLLFGLLDLIFRFDLIRSIYGWHFTLFGFMLFLTFSYFKFDESERKRLYLTGFISSLPVMALSIFEHLLPINYWATYFNLQNFGYGQFTVVGVNQSTSFVGGPNQLGLYLVIISCILISGAISFKSKWINYLLLILYFLAIALTFSRSALLALLVIIIIGFFLNNKYKLKEKISLLVILIFVLGASVVLFSTKQAKLMDLITHGQSNSLHSIAINETLGELKQRVNQPLMLWFGKGLGTAGPAITKIGGGIIPENWYMQIILEMGLVGFLFVMIILINWLILIYKKINNPYILGLGLGLIAILFTNLFLHSWSDAPAAVYTTMILLGLEYEQLT